MKVYKYDIDWQMTRVQLKAIKDIEEKIKFVSKFYKKYKSQANKERILNWIDGLIIVKSLSSNDKKLLTNYMHELEDSKPASDDKNSRSAKEQNFSKYSNDELELLFNDLFVRAKKWLSAGYINKEFDTFMKELKNNIEPSSDRMQATLNKYDDLRERAKFLPNTHKWIY